ncbi:MAG: hypothetical protein ACHQQQ_00035 [Bacteroidota bacterium]
MKITFPDTLDTLNLQPDRLKKNDADSSHVLRPDDILYIVDELEHKIGANNSTDPDSMDYRISALEEQAAAHGATIAFQQSLIAAQQALTRALLHHSNKTSVTTTGTLIQFTVPMNADYVILGNCYNAAGELTGYVVSNQTPAGFTITPDEDGTFEWAAVQVS